MHSFKRYFPLLSVIFLLTILVRIPTLNRPLSKHHEFCTAVALRILQIWDREGISTYNYNPVMTYSRSTDKFINNHASGSGEMMDEAGNYYYASHPPFAYYLPFLVFKSFRVKPDVLPLQFFNLFISFLCGIGIYLILCQLIPEGVPGRSISTIAGYVAYLFTPATLWFHSNVYMADILVQLFFVYGVYLSLKISSNTSTKWIAILSATTFLMVYTSWLGVLFGATLISLEFFRAVWGDEDKSVPVKVIFAVVICLMGALALTAFQYSQIAGWLSLKHEWAARFMERSGFGTNVFSNAKTIITNYLTSYLLLVLFILIFSIARFRLLVNNKLIVRFIIVSLAPVILLHIFLSDYSGHDFTTLYGGVFLSVMFGLFIKTVSEKFNAKLIISGLVLFATLNVLIYYYINRPGEYSLRGDRYADMMDIGKIIADQSSVDEVIFLNGMKPFPEIVFYTGRNILQVENSAEAKSFLEKNQTKKGVIFRVNRNKVSEMSRINSDQSD